MKKYKRIIFWFRQDLRIFDNVGLYNAVQDSIEVLPLFVFDTNILSKFYPQDKRLGFVVSALDNLESQLKSIGGYLHLKHGNPEDVFFKLLKKYKFDAIYTNRSYGPYGKKRDLMISNLCRQFGIEFKTFEDFLLVEPEKITPYKVFTPYFKKWQQTIDVQKPLEINRIVCPKIYIKPKFESINKLDFIPNEVWKIDFGRQRLEVFDFCNYNNTRNLPALDGSSKLSVYIRFGLISIRQVYQKALESQCEGGNIFVSQLAWRDFWQQIFHYFPETYFLEFQSKRRNLNWQNNEKFFEAWKNGMTGYPLVDAGMRQLKKENWMHNRVRMVVASFLTKHLMIDRRRGEEYFRKMLLDIDINVNIGNWQWSASVGPDPKPMRIFNPMLQAKKFDSDCKYIKKYVPELKNVPNQHILAPNEYKLDYAGLIVDHLDATKNAKMMYLREN